MESTTSSAKALTTAYEWLRQCMSTHGRCHALASTNSSTLPSRLIDIGRDGDTNWSLRIVHEDGLSSKSAPYMTLSYRWGTDPKLILLSSNIAEFRAGKPIDILPQTFRDFVTVARRFGIQYVWIDALCIIQDSVDDWEAEAPTMRHVYANSVCTVAASASNTPEKGMFRYREPKTHPGWARTVQSSLVTGRPWPCYIFDTDYWRRQIDGPLLNRGWVLQERYLSPRVLYFGKSQLLWECATEHKCESFPRGVPVELWHKIPSWPLQGLSNERMSPRRLFDEWNELLREYSVCDLTKSSDKLFAMVGIVTFLRDISGDEYVAGWWKSSLVESLDWLVVNPRPLPRINYRAPSWSWASVDGHLVPAAAHSDEAEMFVQLLDVHVATRGSHTMANIIEASLVLKCTIFTATVCHCGEYRRSILAIDGRQLQMYLYPDTLDIDISEGKRIVCIPLKKLHGLKHPEVSFLIAEEVVSGGCNVRRHRRLGVGVLGIEEWERFPVGRETTNVTLI